ncbi:hypothetical protein [Rhizobium sullae]|uniref:hypothetical protein n=1 Tax=Rhizobium sullae TaxID=50338 RepID=UPI000B35CD4C|nr:hypothetical protein [Rhizobium sullae]
MNRRTKNDVDKAATSKDRVEPNAFEGMTVMEALEVVGFSSALRPRILLPQGKPREPLRRSRKK